MSWNITAIGLICSIGEYGWSDLLFPSVTVQLAIDLTRLCTKIALCSALWRSLPCITCNRWSRSVRGESWVSPEYTRHWKWCISNLYVTLYSNELMHMLHSNDWKVKIVHLPAHTSMTSPFSKTSENHGWNYKLRKCYIICTCTHVILYVVLMAVGLIAAGY